jgi:hypothetical protein
MSIRTREIRNKGPESKESKGFEEYVEAAISLRKEREAKAVKDAIQAMNPAERQKYLLEIKLMELQESAFIEQIKYHQTQVGDINDKWNQLNRTLLINAVITVVGIAITVFITKLM